MIQKVSSRLQTQCTCTCLAAHTRTHSLVHSRRKECHTSMLSIYVTQNSAKSIDSAFSCVGIAEWNLTVSAKLRSLPLPSKEFFHKMFWIFLSWLGFTHGAEKIQWYPAVTINRLWIKFPTCADGLGLLQNLQNLLAHLSQRVQNGYLIWFLLNPTNKFRIGTISTRKPYDLFSEAKNSQNHQRFRLFACIRLLLIITRHHKVVFAVNACISIWHA